VADSWEIVCVLVCQPNSLEKEGPTYGSALKTCVNVGPEHRGGPQRRSSRRSASSHRQRNNPRSVGRFREKRKRTGAADGLAAANARVLHRAVSGVSRFSPRLRIVEQTGLATAPALSFWSPRRSSIFARVLRKRDSFRPPYGLSWPSTLKAPSFNVQTGSRTGRKRAVSRQRSFNF